jgi:hypothetical protein
MMAEAEEPYEKEKEGTINFERRKKKREETTHLSGMGLTSKVLDLDEHVVETQRLVDVAVRTTGETDGLVDELFIDNDLSLGVGELLELLSDDEDGADEAVVARLERGEAVVARLERGEVCGLGTGGNGGDVERAEEGCEGCEDIAEGGGDR